MKAFIDTSSLIKKYVHEKGSDDFDNLLEKISEIIIAPVFWLEINSGIERRLREKTLTSSPANRIRNEIKRDLFFYNKITWKDNLEQHALLLIQKYQLKILDSVQLAAARLSKADIFVTSDRKLFRIAQLELENPHFI